MQNAKGYALECMKNRKRVFKGIKIKRKKNKKLGSTSSDNPNGLARFNTCSESAV